MAMRFATKVSKNWKEEVGKIGENVIVDVDLGKVDDFEDALKTIGQQTIVSCRPDWIGGEFLGSEVDRIECMEKGIEAGADFAELEWDMMPEYRNKLMKAVLKSGCAPIVSMYYPKVPSKADIDEFVKGVGEDGAVAKIVARVNSYQDCLNLMKKVAGENVVVSGSGEKGELLDLLSGLCGYYFGFVRIEKLKRARNIKIGKFDIKGLRKVEAELMKGEEVKKGGAEKKEMKMVGAGRKKMKIGWAGRKKMKKSEGKK